MQLSFNHQRVFVSPRQQSFDFDHGEAGLSDHPNAGIIQDPATAWEDAASRLSAVVADMDEDETAQICAKGVLPMDNI
jgi:hypothetical protein